jgi:hypothetical protein
MRMDALGDSLRACVEHVGGLLQGNGFSGHSTVLRRTAAMVL